MENLFENDEVKERIQFILNEYGSSSILDINSSAKKLNQFVDNYNWDDGLEVPYYIMNHVNCDLGTALKMFYLSDGLEILDDEFYEYFDKKWVCFVELLYNKIKNNEFKIKENSYKIPLSIVEREQLKKSGKIAEIFLTDIIV